MYKKHISCKILYNDDKEEKENGEVLIRRFIQRDKNAVLNFKYLTEYYLKYKTRPIEYTIKKINNAKK